MAIFTVRGLSVEERKRVPTARGFTTEADGRTDYDVEFEIDEAAIARQMGPRALKNKSGASRLASGAIVCRVIAQRRVPA
jgi:hypothetical protein